jgi:hypothetical protein
VKTFTLQEARTLLPVLRSLLEKAIAAGKQCEEAEQSMVALARRIQLAGGMMVDVRKAAHQRAVGQHAVQQANDALKEIDSIGVQVKDLETGLLDFPFQLDSEVVLLCWKLGEQDIGYWHSMEEGFRGRQALDERFYRGVGRSPRPGGDNSKPN